MSMRTGGVVVASRISHSLYLARALHRAGVLSHYLGPVVFEPGTRALGRPAPSARQYQGVAQTPLSRLWAAEAVTQVAQRYAPNDWLRHAPGATALDLELTARLAAMRAPGVLHWHTNSLRLAPALARRRGAYLIADHRALHPLQEHPDGSPLRAADIAELSRADLVIVNSTVARDSLTTHGVDPDRIRVIELGVDSVPAADTGRPLADRAPTLLFVGGVEERKGLDTLIQALPAVGAGISEVAVVGSVRDHALAERLRQADPRVRLYGPLPRAEVLRAMAEARLLCLPSRFEAFGLVVPEALSMGTPVVVSSGCGSADLVTGPDAGAVFSPDDASGLARAVAAVLAAPGARPQVPASSSWDAYEQRVAALYANEVLPALASAVRRG